MRRAFVAALSCLVVVACPSREAAAPLTHDAYVWARVWNEDVADAVRAPPTRITTLRVLVRDEDAQGATRVAVDIAALAASGHDVIAVWRIDGARPPLAHDVAEVLPDVHAWRARGVRVVGLELDHDCATSALPEYAAWLQAQRITLHGLHDDAGLSLSATALPTWTQDPRALSLLRAAVDDLVVQVHAVRAPRLFDAAAAYDALAQVAATTGRPFRVALPTYRVTTLDGTALRSDPDELQRFVRTLHAQPVAGLIGIVWFRLGHRGDNSAWSSQTLAAVVDEDDVAPRVHARLARRADGAVDIVLHNDGAIDVPLPGRVQAIGPVVTLHGVRGYVRDGAELSLRRTDDGVLPAGRRAIIGFVQGATEVRIASP